LHYHYNITLLAYLYTDTIRFQFVATTIKIYLRTIISPQRQIQTCQVTFTTTSDAQSECFE